MTSSKLRVIIEQLEKNYKNEGIIKESTDGSSDNNTSTVSGQFAPLILPLVKKLYAEALLPQIADVQPMTSPVGKVAALLSVYSGSEGSTAQSNLHPLDSFLLAVNDTTGLSVEDILTAADGTEFKIHYIEENRLLVSTESGSYVPVKADVLTSVAAPTNRTVSYASRNRASVKKLLKGYSGTGPDGAGRYLGYSYGYDDSSNVKFLGFETKSINVVSSTRKLKSKFSADQIIDITNLYKENGPELAAEALANEIRQEIDKEFITYLKFIAKLSTNTPLDLEKSIAAQPSGALQDVASELVANVFLAAEQIVKDTKRSRRVFIIADPITAALLQTSTFFIPAKESDDNIYQVGSLGTYPLFVDLYAEPSENYVLVGYRGSNNNDGDSGVIYAPYTTNVLTAVDPATFSENLLYLDRYAIARHPQDTGNVDPNNQWGIKNEGNSDFFKMFLVDFGTTTLANFADTSLPVFE